MIKKILFISCSAGSGHIKAAEALHLACAKKYPQIQSWHFNISDDWNFLLRHSVTTPYEFALKHYPALFGAAYKLTDSAPLTKAGQLFNFLLRFGVQKHLDKISEFGPEAVVYTHFIPALMLSKFLDAPQYMLVTDYYAHKIWRVPNMKAFFVPTEETKKSMGKFAPACAITGLPVSPEFKKVKPIAELKTKLGLTNDQPVVLFMPTVPGKVDIGKVVLSLRTERSGVKQSPAIADGIASPYRARNDKQLNIIIILGKNQGDIAPSENLRVIKPVPNIDEYMRIADVIVTKAGGMSITEIAYLRKPMLIINPIPGQEEYNAKIFCKLGYCLVARDNDELEAKIKAALSGQLFFKAPPLQDAAEKILNTIFGQG
ncbi:glycosyltransferase [Patescibacteria group bacterium]|nr:MAG: glycosyltransferase [Patescibacteria group bacterium]